MQRYLNIFSLKFGTLFQVFLYPKALTQFIEIVGDKSGKADIEEHECRKAQHRRDSQYDRCKHLARDEQLGCEVKENEHHRHIYELHSPEKDVALYPALHMILEDRIYPREKDIFRGGYLIGHYDSRQHTCNQIYQPGRTASKLYHRKGAYAGGEASHRQIEEIKQRTYIQHGYAKCGKHSADRNTFRTHLNSRRSDRRHSTRRGSPHR